MRTVQFLEELGRNPTLTAVAYVEAVESLDVDSKERDALLGRDASKLASMLGGRAQMWCAVLAPDDVPDEEPMHDEPMHDEPDPDPDQ